MVLIPAIIGAAAIGGFISHHLFVRLTLKKINPGK
jgi:hypothetical protein